MSDHRLHRTRGGQHVRSCIAGLERRSKVWFEVGGRFAIGEGGIALLETIEREGSIARAATSVGWSYRHAWGYLRRAEEVLGTPLTATKSGKGRSRGTTLTMAARAVIEALHATARPDGRV